MQQITRIPLKYLEILKTQSKESVWKLFINILWGREKLNDNERIFFNLIMVDVNNINKQAENWKKWGAPKKKTPKKDNKDILLTSNQEEIYLKADHLSELAITEDLANQESQENKEAEPKKELDEFDKTFLWVKPIEEQKKEYWDKEVNKCLEIIKSVNGWIVDWSVTEQRKYSKLLIDKINKINKIKSWERTRYDYLSWLLAILSKSKYDARKIWSPRNIFYNLAQLQQAAIQTNSNPPQTNNNLVSDVEL